MASFFSKLFGGGAGENAAVPVSSEPVAYEGFFSRANPKPEGGQWRLAGEVIQETDSGPLTREFVRADVFVSREEAEDFSIRKGKQIIDEQGKRLFADGNESGRA